MQRLFKTWLIVIFVLALVATFMVDISSPFFGFLLLPLLILVAIILILGYMRKK